MYDFIVYRIPNIIDDYYRETKYFFQRMFRGYDNRYVWSYHSCNSYLQIKILQQLRDNHCGYPAHLTDEKWNDILDKMIAGFKASLDIDECSPLDEKRYKKLMSTFNQGMKLYIKHYHALWD